MKQKITPHITQLHKQARRHLWQGLLVLGLTIVLLVLYATGTLQRPEQFSYDYRMAWSRDDATLHPSIAVILVDEASLQALDPQVGRWPWPRAVYADVIDFLALAGARAVVFDILFTERDATSNDQRLASASADNGHVVHAFQLFHDSVIADEHTPKTPLPADFVQRHAVPNSTLHPTGDNNRFVIPQQDLFDSSAAMGVVDVEPDRDGIYRRLRLFHFYDNHAFPTLAVAPLMWQYVPTAATTSHIDFAERHIPLDATGRVLVNQVPDLHPYSFAGVYASIQALNRGDLEGMLISPEEFTDKIVFVGASAVGLADVKATPLSAKAPGVSLHANLLSNILADDLLTPMPPWVTYLAIIVLAAATAFVILATPNFLVQMLAPLMLAGLYGGWAVWQFHHNIVYEMAAPLASVVLNAIALWAFIAATEGRDKRRVRAMFSQYVSPAVLNKLVDQSGNLLQAEIGQAERLSILFSDVRGFTSISEHLNPGQVVDLLNTHFSIMSEIIFHHDGTLDKFIGDAIMAFWGAPIRVAHHAEQAVRASIEMLRGLDEVNRRLVEKNYPAIAIGLGVNTGEAILGNIGSARKLDYTVIGDTVNIASRLEGLTKLYGQGVVISEYTRAELPSTFPCAMLDLVRVKGKAQPVAIYAPLALPEDPPEVLAEAQRLAELTTAAFAHYHAHEWDQALSLYSSLPDTFEVLRKLFVSRCEGFMLQPPDTAWDGVYTLTSK